VCVCACVNCMLVCVCVCEYMRRLYDSSSDNDDIILNNNPVTFMGGVMCMSRVCVCVCRKNVSAAIRFADS